MNKQKMISVIIPTKNDFDLDKTLMSIEKNKKPEKTEIIVVDASKGNLENIKKEFPKVRWIYFHNKTNKGRTFVEQLNLGTKKAKGDILVFVDGGCIVEKNWLYELTKPILEENENFVVGLVKSTRKSHHDLDKKMKYVESCGTANTSLKKEVVLKTGERDESFNYGSDVDFSWRARDLGYKIRYAPKAIMYHNWGGIRQDIKRATKYGEARFNLHLKHKNRRFKLQDSGLDLFTIYSILFFFYALFMIPISIFYPIYLLFILIPFFKNIRRSPIKKMIFDFFWGYGFIKKLLEHYLLKK